MPALFTLPHFRDHRAFGDALGRCDILCWPDCYGSVSCLPHLVVTLGTSHFFSPFLAHRATAAFLARSFRSCDVILFANFIAPSRPKRANTSFAFPVNFVRFMRFRQICLSKGLGPLSRPLFRLRLLRPSRLSPSLGPPHPLGPCHRFGRFVPAFGGVPLENPPNRFWR